MQIYDIYLGNVKFITFRAKYTSFRLHYTRIYIFVVRERAFMKMLCKLLTANIIFRSFLKREIKAILRIRRLYLTSFMSSNAMMAVCDSRSYFHGGKKTRCADMKTRSKLFSIFIALATLYR